MGESIWLAREDYDLSLLGRSTDHRPEPTQPLWIRVPKGIVEQ
jgi:hypothetical protein